MNRLLNYHLEFWEEGHIYRVDGELKDSLTRIIKPLSNFDGIPAKNLEKAGQRGTDLHKMASLYFQGILDEQNLWDDYRPILEGLKVWKEENIPEDEEIITEAGLYHPRWDVCCRPDLFSSKGRVWEIKTGAWEEKYVGVQTAAQAGFILANYGIEVKERFCLYPDANGKFETYLLKDRNDERVWMTYLNFYKFHQLYTGRSPWK